jgi:hypothetical protein
MQNINVTIDITTIKCYTAIGCNGKSYNNKIGNHRIKTGGKIL